VDEVHSSCCVRASQVLPGAVGAMVHDSWIYIANACAELVTPHMRLCTCSYFIPETVRHASAQTHLFLEMANTLLAHGFGSLGGREGLGDGSCVVVLLPASGCFDFFFLAIERAIGRVK
jgi:hypothetical protein